MYKKCITDENEEEGKANKNSKQDLPTFNDEHLKREYDIMRHYAPYIEQELKAVERAKRDDD